MNSSLLKNVSVLVNFIAYSDILFANQRLIVKLCHADFLVEVRVIPGTRILSDLAISNIFGLPFSQN